jgi:hypothetical protein
MWKRRLPGIPGARVQYTPTYEERMAKERQQREEDLIKNFDSSSGVFDYLSTKQRAHITQIYMARSKCLRCGQYFRKMYNFGQLKCPVKQHLLRALDPKTNRHICCNTLNGSPGCLLADHIDFDTGYYGTSILLSMHVDYFKAFALLGLWDNPSLCMFTKNVIVALDSVEIQRLETAAYSILDKTPYDPLLYAIAPYMNADQEEGDEKDELFSDASWPIINNSSII